MTAEDGERGQQRRAMEDCSTDERLQQETLSPTDVDQFMLGPNELTFFHQIVGQGSLLATR